MNEKPLNLEKTSSSVLSVLLLIFDLPRTAPTTIGIISFTGASAAQSQAALDKHILLVYLEENKIKETTLIFLDKQKY